MRKNRVSGIGKQNIVVRNSVYSMLGSVGGQCIAVLSSIVMARVIGADGVGIYSISSTLTGILFIFLNMGLGGILQREVARNVSCAGKYLANTLFLRIFVALPASVLVCIPVVFAMGRTEDVLIVILTGIYTGLTGIFLVCMEPITAVEKFNVSFMYSIGQKICMFSATLILLVVSKSLVVMLIGYIVFMLFLIVAELYYVNINICRVYIEFDKKFCKEYVAEALPAMLSASAEYINLRSDILILGLLVGDYESGLYSTATSVYIAASLVPLAIAKAVTPTFNQMRAEGKNTRTLVRKSLRSMISVSFALLIGIVIVGRPAITILFGREFEKAAIYLNILTISLVVMPVNRLFGYLLVGIKKQSYVAIATWLGAIFNIVANFLMINIVGPHAVAITTCVTEALVAALNFFFWKNNYDE